ncbi:MAG: phage major capsid protein [Syntrophomonadaceae bacterium]|nr:phage major capsid protein [Syntrophomonadaceae bacterium]
MAYNSIISRSDAEALIPTEISNEIIQNVPQFSAVMSLARRLPNMSRKQKSIPVLSALISAYFVNGEAGGSGGGLKQTSKAAWEGKNIVAEELAVIVPIPEAVLDDADYDIWGEIKPQMTEAFGRAFDQAALYGTNAPSTWPSNLLTGATNAGNVVTLGTGVDVYDDIMGESGVLALVEVDGFGVNGHIGAMTMKSKLRGLRDANGVPIFNSSVQEKTRYTLDGEDIVFPKNGAIDAAQSLLVSGDWQQLVYSIRQDITYKVLTEAVIQDNTGAIIYNLAQQDMVALRAVMRLGWQLPNPVNALQPTAASRYPFGVLKP